MYDGYGKSPVEAKEDIAIRARITEDDVGLFRHGKFKDATLETKEKWFFVMIYCMGVVCNEYSTENNSYTVSKVQMTKKVSEVTTVQEEALLYWQFCANEKVWVEQYCDKVSFKRKNGKSPEKARKKKSKNHASRTKADTMCELILKIKESRKDGNGEGWDEALLEEANDRYKQDMESSTDSGGTSGSSGSNGSQQRAFNRKKEKSGIIMLLEEDEFQCTTTEEV